MKTTTRITLTALAAALLASAALAQNGPARGQGAAGFAPQGHLTEHFQLADTDKDGLLTRAETEKTLPHMAQHFDALDTDKDGKLSLAEAQAMRAQTRGGMHSMQTGAVGNPRGTGRMQGMRAENCPGRAL
ncbi:hypothetical protein [Viridibacterium curvum]|uniref:EF-hand domain-containing protein n=1 Tax=Viridibacterium curvum TaxID=1101404 RepID=A0ABP9R446_9RHOO